MQVVRGVLVGGRESDELGDAQTEPAQSRINDWPVHKTKARFRDRLVEVAGRIAGGARLRGKRRLGRLAEVCDIDRATLMRQLKTEVRLLVPLEEGDPGQGLPDWQTIYKLVRGTEVPAYLWLHDLGVLSLEDAAALLERELPAHLLSADEQAVIAQYRRLGPQRGQTWLKIGSLLEDDPTPGSQHASSARGPRPAPPRDQ